MFDCVNRNAHPPPLDKQGGRDGTGRELGRVQVTPLTWRMGATAAGSAVLAAGATAAWLGADRAHPGRERLAAAGYAPGVVGLAATAVAGPIAAGMGLYKLGAPLLGLAPERVAGVARVTKNVAGVGFAALAGMAIGTAVARKLGPDAKPAIYPDADIPQPDMARAQLEARETLSQLDTNARDIVIWVPGTMRPFTPYEFKDGVNAAFAEDVSQANMPARPDYQIPQGIADTSAALHIVLTKLAAERRPGQRILLAGESQGAWAMSYALQDPKLDAIVDRAVVWGNPGVSPHQYAGAGDGKWLEFSDEMDVVGRQLEGDAPMMLDGLTNTFDGHVGQAWRVPATMINNPFETGLITRTGVRLLTPGGFDRDPHNYREFMGAAARFLADAPRPDQQD
jgi:hypothetical protein